MPDEDAADVFGDQQTVQSESVDWITLSTLFKDEIILAMDIPLDFSQMIG